MLGLWLFGQVVSDLYRQTATQDWIRGDATIIFFGLDILGTAILLSKNERRKIIFLVGMSIGSMLFTFIHPSDFALDQPWKFGYASGVITLTLLISCFFYARRNYMIAGLLILGIAAVNLLENYRNPVGQLLMILALVFPIIPEQFGRLRILPRSHDVARVAVLFGLTVGTVWVAARLVEFVTSAGLVSEEAKQKNEMQGRGGSLLLGGRPEIQVSLQAVKDSPIVGYGSWAQDPKYVEMLFDMQLEQGLIDREDMLEYESDLIPTHSHLMGAWVWAGILGGVFWFYILWLALRCIIRIAISRPPLAPVYMAMAIGLVWGILFSPFGLSVRVGDALVLVIVIDLLESSPSSRKAATSLRRAIGLGRHGFGQPQFLRLNAPTIIPKPKFPVRRINRFSR